MFAESAALRRVKPSATLAADAMQPELHLRPNGEGKPDRAETECSAQHDAQDEPGRRLPEQHASHGQTAGRVAGDILAWLAEEDERAEAEADAAGPGDTNANLAPDTAVAREAASVADALDAAADEISTRDAHGGLAIILSSS